MISIDKEKYAVNRENYYKTKHKKKQIILGGSLRSGSNRIKRLQNKRYGKSKEWCTFSINRNGKIFQHYDPVYYTDYMGVKDIDKHSISIVLENMGSVFYDYQTEKYLNWIFEECNEELVYEKNWKGFRYWEAYTEAQFDSTVALCRYLCDKYKIPVDSLGFNVHHMDAKNFQGIVTRSNFSVDYNDLNPSFNFAYFLSELGIVYE